MVVNDVGGHPDEKDSQTQKELGVGGDIMHCCADVSRQVASEEGRCQGSEATAIEIAVRHVVREGCEDDEKGVRSNARSADGVNDPPVYKAEMAQKVQKGFMSPRHHQCGRRKRGDLAKPVNKRLMRVCKLLLSHRTSLCPTTLAQLVLNLDWL